MSLKVWYGMGAPAWWRLLREHHFAVDSCRLPAALVGTALSVRNSAKGAIQARRLRSRPPRPVEAPVFVLGHWRCGTTWLHELLAQDPRHAFPRTLDCFSPQHSLVWEAVVTRWLNGILPSLRRPMDAMPVDWQSPQEDEFALLNLGQPSAYRRIAFPNRPWRPIDRELELDLAPAVRERWRAALTGFLAAVASRRPGRLVLKSPLHMARVPLLLDMFPDARFVHIVRDPYDVFPSTVHLWRSMYDAHGLQRPTFQGLEDFVLEAFTTLHGRFDAGRGLIPPGRCCEVRYDALVRDPLATIEEIYARLDLGDLRPARDAVTRRVAAAAGHRTNHHVLAPVWRDAVTTRWGAIIARQGYPLRHGSTDAVRAAG